MVKINNNRATVKLEPDTTDLEIYTTQRNGIRTFGVSFEAKDNNSYTKEKPQTSNKDKSKPKVQLTFENQENIDNLIRRLEDLKVLMTHTKS